MAANPDISVPYAHESRRGTIEGAALLGREFAIVDRYERRARSRRKFAIQAFDEAPAAVITAKEVLGRLRDNIPFDKLRKIKQLQYSVRCSAGV